MSIVCVRKVLNFVVGKRIVLEISEFNVRVTVRTYAPKSTERTKGRSDRIDNLMFAMWVLDFVKHRRAEGFLKI